jgi:GTP cyclohydrolase I
MRPAAVLRADRARAIEAVRDLLRAVGEDADRPGLSRTPERVADLFLELFADVGVDPAGALGAPIAMTVADGATDVVGVREIPFRSMCEHHLLPFEGVVDVYYAPGRFIAGFSRIASLVTAASRRPNLQERLGQQIADAMMAVLEPEGVVVRIEARHGCIAHAEPGAAGSHAVSVTTLGTIPETAWRAVASHAGSHSCSHPGGGNG